MELIGLVHKIIVDPFGTHFDALRFLVLMALASWSAFAWPRRYESVEKKGFLPERDNGKYGSRNEILGIVGIGMGWGGGDSSN